MVVVVVVVIILLKQEAAKYLKMAKIPALNYIYSCLLCQRASYDVYMYVMTILDCPDVLKQESPSILKMFDIFSLTTYFLCVIQNHILYLI